MQKLIRWALLAIVISACGRIEIRPSAQGTGDSGGGNTFEGKPLESYLQDPEQLAATKNRIDPILKSLSAKNEALRALVASGLERKSWYFVPTRLPKLSDSVVGSVVGTDQAALQTLNQVWISSPIFDSMSETDQARLILHEMLMAVKILRFDSMYNQCLALGESSEECSQLSRKIHGNVSDLTPLDYDNVRKAGAEIIQGYAKFTDADWEDLLASERFSFLSYTFRRKTQSKEVDVSDIVSWINSSRIRAAWPRYAFSTKDFYTQNSSLSRDEPPYGQFLWRNSGSCSFKFTDNGRTWAFALSAGATEISTVKAVPQAVRLAFGESEFPGNEYWVAAFLDMSNSSAGIGAVDYSVRLNFREGTLAYVEASEMVCLSIGPDGLCDRWQTPVDAKSITCSSEDKVLTSL